MNGKITLLAPVPMLGGRMPESVMRVCGALHLMQLKAKYEPAEYPSGHSKHRGTVPILKFMVGM